MAKQKKIIVLGATGSIGSSCLEIVRNHSELFKVVGLSAHRNSFKLIELGKEFETDNCILSANTGMTSLIAMIHETSADLVLNGISGSSGLLPSIAALESGKDLALANKETIVMAGPLIRQLSLRTGKKILPVDSEHSAIFNMMSVYGKDAIQEIILTASGGPFRTWDSEKISKASLSDALKHPTWSMGSKITIDSASLANKGLEVIEACRLFDFESANIKVVIHPQSYIHSFIRTTDGVLYAQLSKPDMRHPIFSALTWPEYLPNNISNLSFDQILTMQFEPPRMSDFPLLPLAYRAAELAGGYPIAYNAANEIAVSAFLAGRVSFIGLSEVTLRVLDKNWSAAPESFDEVFRTDFLARESAQSVIAGMNVC